MKSVVCWLLGIALLIAADDRASAAGAPEYFDIVVYGGTSAGIIAAIEAQHLGKRVALIEPSNHLGGLTTGGLGATDIGNKQAIGGSAQLLSPHMATLPARRRMGPRKIGRLRRTQSARQAERRDHVDVRAPRGVASRPRNACRGANRTGHERAPRSPTWRKEEWDPVSIRSPWNPAARSPPRCISTPPTRAI